MRRILILAGLLVLGSQAAQAQSAVIAERKALMKEIGAAIGPMGKMAKGEEAFDLAKVQAGLKVFADNAAKSTKLYPPDSKEGGDTKALPAIWTENDKFQAIFTKFEADSRAALTSIKDEASFKAEFGKVAGNCGACHNSYRAK